MNTLPRCRWCGEHLRLVMQAATSTAPPVWLHDTKPADKHPGEPEDGPAVQAAYARCLAVVVRGRDGHLHECDRPVDHRETEGHHCPRCDHWWANTRKRGRATAPPACHEEQQGTLF